MHRVALLPLLVLVFPLAYVLDGWRWRRIARQRRAG